MTNAIPQLPAINMMSFCAPLANVQEVDLVFALKQQHAPAFAYLYDKYNVALHGAIMRIVNQQETAEDVLQDVFIKINKNIHAYDARKATLFTWMLNLSRHAAIDQIRLVASRGRMRTDEIGECVGLIDATESVLTNTDIIGIKKLLAELNPHEQELLHLAYFKGLTHTEISVRLNIPVGTVKSRLRCAIAKLRKKCIL